MAVHFLVPMEPLKPQAAFLLSLVRKYKGTILNRSNTSLSVGCAVWYVVGWFSVVSVDHIPKNCLIRYWGISNLQSIVC